MLKEPAGKGKIAMLVISPTRELAAQIAEEAKQLTKHHNLRVQVCNTVTQHLMDRLVPLQSLICRSDCCSLGDKPWQSCWCDIVAGDVWRHKHE